MPLVKLAFHYLRYRFRPLHPFEVQAVLTNDCNLRCGYCRCPDMPKETMTADEWGDIVRRLAKAGTLRIKFQGGEPTLHRGFASIAAASRRAGLVTAVITNGVRIAAKPELVDHLDEVVVSLDALTPALHDRHRGPGTHAAALEAIAISAARGRRVYINMVVHRDTLAEIEPMLAFCEARGFRLNAQAVMFGHAYQDGAAEGLRLPEEEERAMYRRLAEWKRAGRPLMFAASSYERTARWADYRVHVAAAAGPSPCMAGRDYLNIDPDGDVHPCGLHAGTFVPMNIRRDGFEAALRHARRHDCRDCSLAYLNERKALFGLRPSALIEFVRRA